MRGSGVSTEPGRLWNSFRALPCSTIILMGTDSPTPFDMLVVDSEKGKLVAVEVKAQLAPQ